MVPHVLTMVKLFLLSSRIVCFAILSNLGTMRREDETTGERRERFSRDFAWRKTQDRNAVGGKAADAHRKVSSKRGTFFYVDFFASRNLVAPTSYHPVLGANELP